jgi:hypothetical protein
MKYRRSWQHEWTRRTLSKINQAQKRQLLHDLTHVESKRVNLTEVQSRIAVK